MARQDEDEPYTQLATRIPKDLHLRLRLHCVQHETSMMDFIVRALQERLARERKRGARGG
jgi:predicted HicB family RNase H-like nuclease